MTISSGAFTGDYPLPALPVPDKNGLVHASTVAVDGKAVLLMGPSGSGKSDLALRMIDRGAMLVSDDYTLVRDDGKGGLLAAPPPALAGKLEVRGPGIITMAYLQQAPVVLAVALQTAAMPAPERYPLTPRTYAIASVDLPLIILAPFEASAAIKLELYIKRAIMGRSFCEG